MIVEKIAVILSAAKDLLRGPSATESTEWVRNRTE
jgi:hypothetical protein